jgi:hypothetical protein
LNLNLQVLLPRQVLQLLQLAACYFNIVTRALLQLLLLFESYYSGAGAEERCRLFERNTFSVEMCIHMLHNVAGSEVSGYVLGDNTRFLFKCVSQHCFICRPSDSTVSEEAVYSD